MCRAFRPQYFGVVLMGNTFGKLGAVLGSAFGPVGTAIGAAGGSVIDGNLAANKERKKANYNHLEKMRRDAEKAGFNPLTVLRATGGQGFNHGQSAALASSTFWETFGNSVGQFVDDNDPYNKKLKELDMQQAQATLDNTRVSTGYTQGLIGQLAANPDVYAPYKDSIPVRVGKETRQLDITVAKRMRIEPNAVITPGDLEELLGEVHGNITSAVALEIQERVFPGSGYDTGYGDFEWPQMFTQASERIAKSKRQILENVTDIWKRSETGQISQFNLERMGK